MKTALPVATKAEKRRFEIITQQIGCIACIQDGHPDTPAETHHLLDTGRRISHADTIPLCPNHHATIHRKKRWFREQYGTDMALLGQTNGRVIVIESNIIGGP